MAVKEFNCNKLKRTFWPFTLKDKVDENGNVVEKGKKIVVRMPQKKVFEPVSGVSGCCVVMMGSLRSQYQKIVKHAIEISESTIRRAAYESDGPCLSP